MRAGRQAGGRREGSLEPGPWGRVALGIPILPPRPSVLGHRVPGASRPRWEPWCWLWSRAECPPWGGGAKGQRKWEGACERVTPPAALGLCCGGVDPAWSSHLPGRSCRSGPALGLERGRVTARIPALALAEEVGLRSLGGILGDFWPGTSCNWGARWMVPRGQSFITCHLRTWRPCPSISGLCCLAGGPSSQQAATRRPGQTGLLGVSAGVS